MKTSRKLIFFAIAALLAVVAAEAVPKLTAPSLYMKQERYNSAVVKVAEITADGRFKLEVIENLYGETADGLVVRSQQGKEDILEAGQVYVIGQTDKPARKSYRWTTDPAGARLLNVPAVGLAVFENSRAMRELVREHPEDDPFTDEKRLAAVLEQLASPHVISRRFVLAELALDPELRAVVGEEELGQLKQALSEGELEPVAREYLLRAATPMVDSWGGEWLAVDCREIAAAHGAELDLVSPIPSLLVNAFRTLAVTGESEDAELARVHVRSNNPGVGKAAFRAMVALDEELAKKTAPEMLELEDLHGDTRREIATYWARVGAATGAS